jgi:hypothetical protein
MLVMEQLVGTRNKGGMVDGGGIFPTDDNVDMICGFM